MYGAVPPVNDEVVESVALWPLSMGDGETLILGRWNARLTVTRLVAESATAGGDDPLVTPVSVTM